MKKLLLMLMVLPSVVHAANGVITEQQAWSEWAGSGATKSTIKTHYECGEYVVYDQSYRLIVNGFTHDIVGANIDNKNNRMTFKTDNGMILFTSIKGTIFDDGKKKIPCKMIIDDEY